MQSNFSCIPSSDLNIIHFFSIDGFRYMLSYGGLLKYFFIIFIIFSLFFLSLSPLTSLPTHASEKILLSKDKGIKKIIFYLAISIGIILMVCEIFANGVKHVGNKADLSHAAHGSLLAQVGTAMTETLISILALVFGANGHGEEIIGIGAILVTLFMLTIIAFFLLGTTVFILSFSGKREKAHFQVYLSAVMFELKYFIFIMVLVLNHFLCFNLSNFGFGNNKKNRFSTCFGFACRRCSV